MLPPLSFLVGVGMTRTFVVALVWGALLVPIPGAAAWFGGEFSAEAVQYDPQSGAWRPAGRVFVSDDRMRLESELPGERRVWIIDAERHRIWQIDLEGRTYTEIRDAPSIPLLAATTMPDESGSACQSGAMKCRRLGEEALHGVVTEKWEFVAKQGQKTVRAIQWLDPVRKVALREELPDGRAVERVLLGKTTLDDRALERWEVKQIQNGSSGREVQYVDPRLKVVVRQEYPDGRITALRNVSEEPPPSTLFEVPEGFERR